jgi:hypothetical protein
LLEKGAGPRSRRGRRVEHCQLPVRFCFGRRRLVASDECIGERAEHRGERRLVAGFGRHHVAQALEAWGRVGPELAEQLAVVYDGGAGWTSHAIDALAPLHALAAR